MYRDFSSGHSTAYRQTGSSEVLDGSFATGSATQYSVHPVTNRYGYEMSTPNDRTS